MLRVKGDEPVWCTCAESLFSKVLFSSSAASRKNEKPRDEDEISRALLFRIERMAFFFYAETFFDVEFLNNRRILQTCTIEQRVMASI